MLLELCEFRNVQIFLNVGKFGIFWKLSLCNPLLHAELCGLLVLAGVTNKFVLNFVGNWTPVLVRYVLGALDFSVLASAVVFPWRFGKVQRTRLPSWSLEIPRRCIMYVSRICICMRMRMCMHIHIWISV